MLSLDALEATASRNNVVERLSEIEFQLLEHLLRFNEQPLGRESLTSVMQGEDGWVPDRILNQRMATLIRKINVLHPDFPLVRRLSTDVWLYTEKPPKKKPRR